MLETSAKQISVMGYLQPPWSTRLHVSSTSARDSQAPSPWAVTHSPTSSLGCNLTGGEVQDNRAVPWALIMPIVRSLLLRLTWL